MKLVPLDGGVPEPLRGQMRQEDSAGGMAAAAQARGWASRSGLPLLLRLLLLLLPPAVCPAARGPPTPAQLSLHPPYFNLAEAARIWATATCGEREPDGARPRPELYCKLVGGPTAPGSGQTIQVRARERLGEAAEGGLPPGGLPPPPCAGQPSSAKGSGPFPRTLVPQGGLEGLP